MRHTHELGGPDFKRGVAPDVAKALPDVVSGKTELIVSECGQEETQCGEHEIPAV